jgi:hypothetical protein
MPSIRLIEQTIAASVVPGYQTDRQRRGRLKQALSVIMNRKRRRRA